MKSKFNRQGSYKQGSYKYAQKMENMVSAACLGNLSAGKLKSYLKWGLDINGKDGMGYAVLSWAIYNRDAKLVDACIANGADLDMDISMGRTAFVCAMNRWDPEIIKKIIRGGAKLNVSVVYNRDTPLHIATRRGDMELIELMLNYGADPMRENIYGETPLTLAKLQGDEKASALFLAHLHAKKLANRTESQKKVMQLNL